MDTESIRAGFIAVGLLLLWVALDWYGHKTGELDEDVEDHRD